MNLDGYLTIAEASVIFQESTEHDGAIFHTADNAYLTAPTFEEFIQRNRLILHEEVVR